VRQILPSQRTEGGAGVGAGNSSSSGSSGCNSFVRGLQEDDAAALAMSDQVTINEYLPGQGIRPHVDTPEAFGSHISSLSLLSPIIMDFRYPGSKEKKSIVLPPRSMLVLTGPARYKWSHGISHRKIDCINGSIVQRKRRVSLTLRKVLEKKAINPLIPPMVERDYVHKFYDKVADHFSHTRWNVWPHVVDFLQRYTKSGSIVFDLGCGNGKYLNKLRMWKNDNHDDDKEEEEEEDEDKNQHGANVTAAAAAAIGIDMCERLVQICGNRKLNASLGDALQVPLKSGRADVAISIAVIHHMSTEDRRRKAMEEMIRVLVPGGYALVTAWAKTQPGTSRRKFDKHDLLIGWQMPKKFAQSNDNCDYGVEESKDGKLVFQRYCHVFEEGEIVQLLKSAAKTLNSTICIIREYLNAGNWCVEFLKK